jgi:hypothetical protein
MPDAVDPLHNELARLLTQITEARENGNSALADLLTDVAAKCLMKIAEAQTASAQQQQQIQPDDKDNED